MFAYIAITNYRKKTILFSLQSSQTLNNMLFEEFLPVSLFIPPRPPDLTVKNRYPHWVGPGGRGGR